MVVAEIEVISHAPMGRSLGERSKILRSCLRHQPRQRTSGGDNAGRTATIT